MLSVKCRLVIKLANQNSRPAMEVKMSDNEKKCKWVKVGFSNGRDEYKTSCDKNYSGFATEKNHCPNCRKMIKIVREASNG